MTVFKIKIVNYHGQSHVLSIVGNRERANAVIRSYRESGYRAIPMKQVRISA